MKLLVTLGLTLSFAATSLAAETKETKREVAQARPAKIKLYSGAATVHRLLGDTPSFYLSIDGAAAKKLWLSLKSTKAVDMGTASPDSSDKWFQKVAEDITCDRVYDAEEKKSEYSCGLYFTDGVTQGGGAG